MDVKEIQRAITELWPDDFVQFCSWFEMYESSRRQGKSKEPVEVILQRTKGALKGSGALKDILEERRNR